MSLKDGMNQSIVDNSHIHNDRGYNVISETDGPFAGHDEDNRFEKKDTKKASWLANAAAYGVLGAATAKAFASDESGLSDDAGKTETHSKATAPVEANVDLEENDSHDYDAYNSNYKPQTESNAGTFDPEAAKQTPDSTLNKPSAFQDDGIDDSASPSLGDTVYQAGSSQTEVTEDDFNEQEPVWDADENNAPEIVEDIIYGNEDQDIAISIENILGNDVDVDGDSFEFVSFGATRNGEIITNPDGSYIFKPNANYNSSDGNSFDRASAYHHGEAGFQYTIRDEYDAEQTGWVKVQVNAVNDAPSVEGHVITYDDLASTPYPDGNPVVQGYSTIIDIDSDLTTLSVCHSTSTSFSITDQSFDDMQNEARLSYNYVGIYSFSSHWVDGEPSGHYVTSVSYVTSVFTVTLNDSGLVSNNIWLGASHGVCIGDPIVFDLDGDGVELLGTDHGVTFDTNNDGVAENIGWVSPDDGFLVWDRNQDGLVDDFNELNFTDVHPDAFTDLDAMSLYFDSNQDGVFNASDDHWDEFGVWNDANSNGVTDEGEFKSMEEAGIASVNVEGQDVNYDQDGNQVVGETEYTDSDGESHEAKVVFLDIEEGSMGESGLEIAAADYQPLDAETAAIFQQADAINSMMAAEALTIPEDVTAMPIAADMPVYEYAAEEECYSVG